MAVTAVYAGALAFFYLVLSFWVIFARGSERVEIGTGESPLMLRRTRVHANFAEYTPYVLLLMGLSESLSASLYLLHLIGGTLAFGRLTHAYGLANKVRLLRALGMISTFTSLIIGASACLALGVMK